MRRRSAGEETLELRGWTIRFDVSVEVPEADRRPC